MIEWKSPEYSDHEWQSVFIPKDLTSVLGDNGETRAWLRSKYTVQSIPSSPQALVLGIVGDNDEVYIDGELIGKTGEFPPLLKLAMHKSRAYLLPDFALSPGEHTLSIRLYKWGGPGMGIVSQPPYIDSYYNAHHNTILYQIVRSDIPFALGTFLFCISCYLLLIYVTCKVERQYLYCGSACLMLCLYCLGDSWKVADFLNVKNTKYVFLLSMATICLCNYLTFRFVRSATRKAFSLMDRINLGATILFCVAYILCGNATELNFVSTLFMPQVIITNTYVGLTLYRNFRALRNTSSVVLLTSFLVLITCVAHDIYATFYEPYLLTWISYGYFTYCVGISFFLAQDYSGALVDRMETRKLEEYSRTLEEVISKDALTGLVSRESFMSAFEAEVALARNSGQALTFAVMDVDHFKFYNDAYGHPAGDRLLKSLGWIMQKWTRDTDSCGRIGGEEFAILLRGTTLADAYRACERLRKNIETFPFENMGKNGQHVTVSIGLATFSDKYPTRDQIYKEADQQLYLAKKLRNHIEPEVVPVQRIHKNKRGLNEKLQATG